MGGFLLEVKMSVVSKLQIVLEATTTAFDRGLKSAQQSLDGFAKKTQDLHDRMDKFGRKHKDTIEGLQSAGQAAAVGLGVMAVGIKGAVTAAVDFEKSMAGVKKVIDFDTPEAFKQMERDIIALSQTIPMSAEGLANIMAAAGQSGIAQNELMRFTETAAKMGVAFDITAEQAGQALAEMRVAFKMNQDEVEALADKINYLGNTSPNSAAKIMQITQAVGAVAELGGFAADQIAALASGIVGIDPSSVATGLKNISLELTVGDNATKSQRAAFERLGLDAADVARRMKEDAVGTLMEIATLVNEKIPEYEQSAVSAALVGREALPVFAQIVQNQEMITGKLHDVGDASKYAGSMLKEFESMAGTSAAQMQLFDNNIQAMKIAFGSAFLPVLNQAMEAITPILKAITEWAQKNPELVQTITAIVGGVLGAIAALGGLALAFTAVTGGIAAITAIATTIAGVVGAVSSAVSIVGMFGGALAALGFPVTAVVAGIAALVAAGVALYMNWDTIKVKAIEVWNAIPEYANQAWQWMQGVWGGIGAWFAGIWDSVKSAVSTAIDGVKQAFFDWLAGMPAPVQEMVANIGSIFDGLVSVASAVWNGLLAVVKFAADGIVSLWQGFVSIISGIWNGIVNVATTVWNGIVSVVASVINAIKPIVSSVVSFFSSVWQGLVGIAKSIWEGIKSAVSAAMTAIKAIFTAGLTVFASIFNAGFNTVKNIFTTTFNVIKALVRGDMNGVKTAIATGLQNAVSIAKSLLSNILSAFTSLGSQLLGAGRDAIQGFINGITGKMGEALAKARELANKVVSTVKSALDIHSPSRVMKALGGYAGEGFVLGLGEKVKDAKQKAQELANAVTSTISELHKQKFLLQNTANSLAELDYKLQFGELAELTDKQKARIKELA